MTPGAYFEAMGQLARDTRESYGLEGPRVSRTDMRGIFREQGITVDYWPYALRKLRGSYHNDGYGVSVMVAKNLPDDPAIFTLAHELKHHLVDQDKILSICDSSNFGELVEVSAEVFAAEFLLPTAMMGEWFTTIGVGRGNFEADSLVRFKRETRTTLSYAGLVKHAERLNLVAQGNLAGIQWKKLEESIYGLPVYRRYPRKHAV